MTAPALDVQRLRDLDEDALDAALRAFARDHGAEALPALSALAAGGERGLRRAARRALYRLAQRGVAAPAGPGRGPVVESRPERATRAWLSGIDGSGSRAAWVLFEGGLGGARLCSLIVNDTVGVVDAAGGDITKKRLESELEALRASQKLPWVETDPARALALGAEALALHRDNGTTPPPAFARWRRLFEDVRVPAPPPAPAPVDASRVARGAELLDLPETAGWFLDPEPVQADALELLEARQSRLVVSDQIKAERQAAIVDRVVERELTPAARRLWARRLAEMAWVFEATGRPELGAIARAAAGALADPDAEARHQPFARGLAQRALELAGEVASGRISAADVSRKIAPSSRATRG
ncbi:MAG: hypothetical protein DMD92_18305 [Candidatus Rokuibacteriota bacterium]|nr:MAG: hypothetical protein DMD92_18305 [Candidatus Rokubacteria bacterium]